jgi:hypothetical protein
MRLFLRSILPLAAILCISLLAAQAQAQKPDDTNNKDDNNWLLKAVQEQEKLQKSHMMDTDEDLLKNEKKEGDSKVGTDGEVKSDTQNKKDNFGLKTDANKDGSSSTFDPLKNSAPGKNNSSPGSPANDKKPNSALTPLTPFSSYTTSGINNLGGAQNNLSNNAGAPANDPAKQGLSFGLDLPKANPLLALPDYQSSKQPEPNANAGYGNYGYSMNPKPANPSQSMPLTGSDSYFKTTLDQQTHAPLAPQPLNTTTYYNSGLGHAAPVQPPALPSSSLLTQPPRRPGSQPAAIRVRVSDPNDFLDR